MRALRPGGLDEVRLERFKTARLRNRTEQAVQTRLGPPVRLESSTLDLARGGVVEGGPVGPCACPSATLSAIAPAPGSARRASSAVVGHRPEHKRAFSRIASGDWSRLAADHGDAYRLHRLGGEKSQVRRSATTEFRFGSRLMVARRRRAGTRALGDAAAAHYPGHYNSIRRSVRRRWRKADRNRVHAALARPERTPQPTPE